MKPKLITLAALLVAVTLAVAACAPLNQTVDTEIKSQGVAADGSVVMNYADTGAGSVVAMPPGAGGGAADAYGAPAEQPASASVVDQAAAGGQAGADRMVIKNATLSIVVDDPAKTVDAITRLTDEMGGFVVSLNTAKSTYGPQAQVAEQASMVIRVPSARLNEALAKLKGMAVEVNNEAVSGQDVTSEYTDLQSRLTNLQAAEKQLQSIMAEATKTEDVLAVYYQLVATREQIELIKGQMKYYEQSAAMSAISLDILPNIVTQPIEVGGWHPEGAAKQAIEDTLRFLQNATDGLIYFGIARLPFLLVFGIPAALIGRWAWRRTKKAAAKPAAAPEAK